LGAALLALELLGVAVTPQLVATMRQSAQAKGLEMP
jgi:hypothetical protein